MEHLCFTLGLNFQNCHFMKKGKMEISELYNLELILIMNTEEKKSDGGLFYLSIVYNNIQYSS